MSKRKNFKSINYQFKDSALTNSATYYDYLNRLKKIALSMFEWVNLPSSMNARFLEQCLYYYGQASLLYDENYGFINTQCSDNGYINIYNLPTQLHCYSNQYHAYRNLYCGLSNADLENDEKDIENAILVMNNFERIATCKTLELFAYRLYEAESTAMINIKAQKTPILIIIDENQRLLMENIYSQYDGNKPVIFGDKKQLDPNFIKSINTQAPYIADKVIEYKKEIWNEALTFLGINNVLVDKKERLVSDEANSNNELINLNLQSYLITRKEACKQFNELFGLTGTDKEIDVKIRSDLHNIIKNNESIISDYEIEKNEEEVIENG